PIWQLIKPGLETVNNPVPDPFRPQNQGLSTQNPKQTRPQPPVETGWADKAESRPPLRGPGGWGGDCISKVVADEQVVVGHLAGRGAETGNSVTWHRG